MSKPKLVLYSKELPDCPWRGDLHEFLQICCPGGLATSPHVRKMIDEIAHSFPRRLQEAEMCKRLKISQRWLQKLCRQAFDQTYTCLKRRIWIHQALRMMRDTDLDSTEIAMHLNYSEESNMARDFRNELKYSPSNRHNKTLY